MIYGKRGMDPDFPILIKGEISKIVKVYDSDCQDEPACSIVCNSYPTTKLYPIPFSVTISTLVS